jgi:hypothetical protein
MAVGGIRNHAIAKTALATSDALNMDLSKTDPSVDITFRRTKTDFDPNPSLTNDRFAAV